MSDYRFSVRDVISEPYAAAPQLTARLRIDETTGVRVHAIALRCQVRIEPQRRRYDEVSAAALLGLFGERSRWGDTLKSFTWMHCNATVPGFSGHAEFALAMPCTYDLEVIGTRYLHALDAGDIPLTFLFSGTIFTRGDTGFAVEQVPWACEAKFDLPVFIWRQMIESYFPNTGWLRLSSDTLVALADFRARHGLTSWDETVLKLLGGAS
ncbi:DUF6084 family protein [Actinoplanes sp. NPDC051411]|uniref:DUF6084 family protein n=1 Tax=Actinoplanes sp. NPDC051411 TaxID=3155522 RepID=UPI0034447360